MHRAPFLFACFALGASLTNAAEPVAVSGSRIAFPQSLAPLPQGARVLGPIDATRTRDAMELQIALRMNNGAELERDLARGRDTSATVAHNFPAARDYEALVAWLKARGFQLTNVDRTHRLMIGFRGTTAQIAAAFRVRFARIDLDGAEMIAAVSPPSLPLSIGRAVLSINGLQPFLRANKGPLFRPKNVSTPRQRPLLNPR